MSDEHPCFIKKCTSQARFHLEPFGVEGLIGVWLCPADLVNFVEGLKIEMARAGIIGPVSSKNDSIPGYA